MTDPDPRISSLIVLLLIYLASWFAITETSLASVSRNKLKIASERGDYRADDALYALDNFDKAITTILICTNITHISAATIVTLVVTRYFDISWVSLSTVIMTILVFFFGEMLPKSLAKKTPEKYALSHSHMLIRLMKLLSPLSGLLSKIGNIAAKLTKSEAEISVTEDELYDIIDDMEEEGTLEEDESELIQSAIEFGDQKVLDILTPKEKVFSISIKEKPLVILNLLKNQTHSRIPVYDGSKDNIVGVLQLRDFIKAYLKDGDKLRLYKLIKKPLFVKSNSNIDDILSLMAAKKHSLAMVLNNKGRFIGIISTEDILEELVGEIYDEDEALGGEKC